MLATAMPLPYAVGTSLVVVTALGLTTAGSYAISGLVDWPITGLLVAGGMLGTLAGMMLGKKLSTRKGILDQGFAILVIAIGAYVAISAL